MPTNPSSPESLTLETLLDKLTEAAENRRDANLDADAGEVERESYESEYRSSREAVTQRLAELEAQNGKLFEELLWANDELTRLRSRIAELESLLDRTRNLANANLAEMDAKVSLLEAARNDLLLVVEELNDLRKTAEANALTPEEAKLLADVSTCGEYLYEEHPIAASALAKLRLLSEKP